MGNCCALLPSAKHVQHWQWSPAGDHCGHHPIPFLYSAPLDLDSPQFQAAMGTVQTPVYRRSDIPRDARIAGPAIIEQADTTTVVYPGQVAETGSEGILFVRSQAEGNGRK